MNEIRKPLRGPQTTFTRDGHRIVFIASQAMTRALTVTAGRRGITRPKLLIEIVGDYLRKFAVPTEPEE